jgi:tRNA nucleotidyltransferase (CCA-adding enzyme)
MANVKAILAAVAARITPVSKPAEVKEFVDKLNATLRKQKIKAKANLGGSFAKDTFLKGDHDVDVFVAFDLGYAKKNPALSDVLGSSLKAWKPERVHGSRDYFIVRKAAAFKFEVIPVLAIKKSADAQNITDFSLQHVTWVNARSKKLKDDIRLTKKFCKGQRVYGAESYIRGFSGHVVDLLVIHYGGFLPLLRAASKWTVKKGEKTIIDIPKAHHGKALFVLNKSKTEGPLVLVDPVQPDRNAAASLTQENYERFIVAAKKFLAAPSEKFFEREEPDFDKLAKRGTIVLIAARPTTGSDDVVGTRLLKLFEHVKRELETAGFTVLQSAWEWRQTALLWYCVKEARLPPTMEVEGPPAAMKQHAEAFKRKHKKVVIKRGRLVAIAPVQDRTPEAVARRAVKDERVKDKAAGVSVKCW